MPTASFARPAPSVRSIQHAPPRLLTLGLTLATLVIFFAAAVVLSPAPTPGSSGAPPVQGYELALAFYDTVDQTLRSGDDAPLEAMVAPDLVTHDAFGVSHGRTNLEQRLAALRLFSPSLQLAPVDVIVDADRAVVSVVAAPLPSRAATGALPAPGWATLDLLRFADHRLVERWAIDEQGPLAQVMARTTLVAPLSEPVQSSIARLTFDPGASAAGADRESPLVIALATGALRARLDGSASPSPIADAATPTTPVAVARDVSLAAGQSLVIPAGGRFTLRNEAGAPAVVLAAALSSTLLHPGEVLEGHLATGPIGGSMSTLWPDGVQVAALAGSRPLILPDASLTLTVSRVLLAPGGNLALPARYTLDQFVTQSDQLRVQASGPATGFEPGAMQEVAADGSGDAAVDAGMAHDGATASLHNVGAAPLIVWIVTIAPADE